MEKAKILVIDDENQLRKAISRILELDGYIVFQADNGRKGLNILKQEKNFDLVISDVKLPDINGIQILEAVKRDFPVCEVIMITAYGTINDGVYAMKAGAFDYITKGDQDEHIVVSVEKALEKSRLKKRIVELENRLEVRYSFERIIGKSSEIKSAVDLAKKVAPTDSTVLLQGETGTGKELFAQSIHNASNRKDKPFIAINCSSVPKELMESEFFGHKKGAFTGANSDKKGYFEEANGGTLFLDEISEMSLDLQAKLLRVLEEQTFTRVGESKQMKVNVRIVAATNKDIFKESQEERFRLDLFYRLSVFLIKIPALRSRKSDIPLLAKYFIEQFSFQIKKRIDEVSDEFIELLKENYWLGNTRELKNVIERAVILVEGNVLRPEHLPFEIRYSAERVPEMNKDSIEEIEKNHILKILEENNWNKTKAAEKLGIGIPTLYRKISQYGITK